MYTVFSASMMAACGSAVFLLLPLLVGQMMDYRGLDEREAGLVASTYFAAYLLSSASAFFWMRVVNMRRAGIAAYLLMVVGLVLAMFSASQFALSLCMAISGIGGGMLYALAVAVVSATQEADRNFGWLLVAQQLVAALLLLIIPAWVTPLAGFTGTLAALALLSVLLAGSSRWTPAAVSGTHRQVLRADGGRRPVLLALLALVVHFSALSALWAFVDRLGSRNGLSPEAIGNALGLSMIAGLAGALLVTWVADRYGRRLPLWLAALAFFLTCYGFYHGFGWIQFAVLTAAFSFTWNFVLAYQMGVIADLDRDGRHALLMPAAQASGAMLGPALGGWLIAGPGYSGLLALTVGCIFGSTLVFSSYAGLLTRNRA
jgi:MFS family permease